MIVSTLKSAVQWIAIIDGDKPDNTYGYGMIVM